ncbi:restriction endonuclease S subunit [Streptococcus pyogenes]|uniref:restriction endonuclease subunit S n=1 Tax=Streptococcus pyogenes TaxID=1314 RepID=UPI000DA2D307|nr:restriction endonuclease subunit S [Streptococcus pyogenes]SQG41359.1 restriction endonuclease S subunit [Streptococcus pyogenes]VGU74996.1 restriction endonuclease S subunit [Streptococcus pyogenes]VGU87864.1 restriction endonuclease S subunit [Streptococcus pyogenes]VGV10327.1 restriction endonuclease S subunit [Streptococcus pyogenes]VHC41388.1 restriction endonuclease S subunit [Streptococcus pyogenes]
MTKSKQPQYRFDGFEGEWEEKILGDVVSINSGKDYKHLNSGNIPVYGTGGYMLSVDKSLAEQNGIGIGRKGTIDKPYILEAPFWTVDTLFYCLPEKSQNLQFIFSIFQRINWKKLDESTGVPSLSKQAIKKVNISTSSLPEQEAIGELFQTVDQLLQLQDQKLATLKAQKQTFLRKMFPAQGQKVPEIRLQGFDGEWEEKKLGEVSPLRGGYAFESDKFQSDGIKIIRISNILSSGIIGGEFAHYHQINNDDKYLLTGGSALIAMSGATTGKVSILNTEEKYYQNQRVGYFMDLNKIHYNFIIAFLKSLNFNKQVQSVLVAGAQPNISSKEIDNFQILYPRHNVEQEAIGNFFQTLDQQIAQSEEKLTELKALKQTLLNRLFV